MKEAKEKKDKRKVYSGRRDRRNSPVRYGGRDSYGSRDRRSYGGRFGGSDGRFESRYGKTGRELVGDSITGERTGRVTHVERRDTSGQIVKSGRTQKDPEQAVASDPADFGESSKSSHNVNVIEINIDEKLVVDAAEKKLEDLVGVIAEDNGDVCLMFEEEEDLENKVHDILARHASFWRESGASSFAISVVENGYVPQMWENP